MERGMGRNKVLEGVEESEGAGTGRAKLWSQGGPKGLLVGKVTSTGSKDGEGPGPKGMA